MNPVTHHELPSKIERYDHQDKVSRSANSANDKRRKAVEHDARIDVEDHEVRERNLQVA